MSAELVERCRMKVSFSLKQHYDCEFQTFCQVQNDCLVNLHVKMQNVRKKIGSSF